MVENSVVRRQNIITSAAYNEVTEDLKTLFNGFNGVSIEQAVPQDGQENVISNDLFLKIYLDSGRKVYLQVVPDSSLGFRVSIHCGNGQTEYTNWANIDRRISSETVSYSMARTRYGAVFTCFPSVTENVSSLSDGCLTNFFTTFETSDGRTVNGIICVNPLSDDTTAPSGSTSMSFLATSEHNNLEPIDVTKCFYGNRANQTVLVNASSYTNPLISRHLFKKIQTEATKFGKISVNGREFIAGSHYCLEIDNTAEV